MDLSDNWLQLLAESIGPIDSVRPMSSAMWRLNAAGIPVVAKRGPSITDEADGLRLLASVAGGPGVPKILYENEDLLVIEWIEPSRQSPGHEDRLGRELAALHAVVAPCWGSGSSWVGQCPIDPICYGDGPDFYRARLVELARRCGLEEQVATLAEKITDLVPFDSPSHLHGDLWWGNIIWGTGERPWLIDPSCHGGHPEEDLAMLGLFGAVPGRLIDAYLEVRPLSEGWADRVALWQLYPLLVHAVLFGGHYPAQVKAIADRYAGRKI